MKIVEIYNNGGRRTTAELMLASRLEALSQQGVNVAAMTRDGEMARRVERIGEVNKTDFGFLQTFTLIKRINRLMGEDTGESVFMHVHSLAAVDLMLTIRDIERREGRRIYVVYEPIGPDINFDRRHIRRIVPKVDLCVFHTEEFRDVVMEMLGHEDERGMKAVVIPPGFDREDLPMRKSGQPKTLVWGGRLTHDSNLMTLMEALVKLRENGEDGVRLIVAGQGRARYVSPILKYVKTRGLGDIVEFVGDRALDEELLSRGDVGVLTNVEYPDNDIDTAAFMSAGLPIIVPSFGGKEPSDIGFGLRYDSGNSDSLAATLHDIYTDEELYGRLSETAILYAWKMHGNRYIVPDLIKAYKSVM